MAFIEARKHTNGGGSWRVIWRSNGQRETERFTNETDAGKFKVYVEAAGENWPPGWIPQQGWAGSFEPPKPKPSMTSTQFVSDSARRRVKASEGTRAGYQLEISRYLEGTDLGLTPWREVTADNVSDWVLQLTARGLSAKTVINVHGLTSAAWKQAIKAGDTVINPFDGLAPKNRKLSEDIAVYLTPEQFRVIWEATPSTATARPQRGFDSPVEETFWDAYQKLNPKSLTGLVTQHSVGKYRLDFAIPSKKIGIEIDGREFHSDQRQFVNDRERQRNLEQKGWRITHFAAVQVIDDPEGCVRKAIKWVDSQG